LDPANDYFKRTISAVASWKLNTRRLGAQREARRSDGDGRAARALKLGRATLKPGSPQNPVITVATSVVTGVNTSTVARV
jgi:hypothetical protein